MEHIKKLILQKRYEEASCLLEEVCSTKENFVIASLLYRLQSEYEKEKHIISKFQGSCRYFEQRSNWHNQPTFHKVVPRPTFHLPRNPLFKPSESVLDKVCFITGGDSKYIELLIELLESINATRLYNGVKLFVLDFGLTDQSKHELLSSFKNIQILEYEILKNKGDKQAIFSFAVRLLFDHLFPNYKYYFWLDADTWIHDERALDLYITAAISSGIGITNEQRKNFFDCSAVCNQEIICEKLWDDALFKQSPYCCCGAMCLESSIVPEWRKIYRQNTHYSDPKFFSEQASMNVLIANKNIQNTLNRRNNFFIGEGTDIACVMKNDNILLEKNSCEPIGIVHLFCEKKWREHYQDSFVENINTRKKTNVSYRYRVWPWQDKQEIEKQLFDIIS